ncbi:MAG: hypothetical protein ACREDU_07580, partial [Methylocella sp.]
PVIEKGTDMTSEQLFLLTIVAIVVIAVAIVQVSKNRHRIKPEILDRLYISPKAEQRKPHEPEQPVTASDPKFLTIEESSKAELERLQKLIKDRKQIAWETDISHHLWSLYESHFRCTSPQALDRYNQDGKWYDLKILQASTANDLNKFEFELNGAKYKFVDDEETQGLFGNMKSFNLFLYDDSDRCLIDIPMKLRVDSEGTHYSISSDAPTAFLLGGWISDIINTSLKHQSVRNQEIRAQKHQERLWEIEDLKDRFGISD